MSLLLLAGYGVELFADCCEHPLAEQRQSGVSPEPTSPGTAHHCDCVCHELSTPLPETVRVATPRLVRLERPAAPDLFPPHAEPVGIDYPPQLT